MQDSLFFVWRDQVLSYEAGLAKQAEVAEQTPSEQAEIWAYFQKEFVHGPMPQPVARKLARSKQTHAGD